jgi:hypothetical protein
MSGAAYRAKRRGRRRSIRRDSAAPEQAGMQALATTGKSTRR